jgi:hypothetical protein
MKTMKSSVVRALVFVLATAAVPISFGASAKTKEEKKAEKTPSAEGDAQLLDQNSYPCSNCFFGTSDTFYCMRVDNRILIAHQHVPTVNWMDPSRNFATKYHKSWTPWIPGSTVHVKYNDKYIWVPGLAGKKDIRMEQKYTTDIFLNDGPCRSAIKVPDESPRHVSK